MLRPHPADPLDQLETSYGKGYRLILITAPAGSGKTALLQQWLTGRTPVAGASSTNSHEGARSRFAWLDLQPEDNVPARFWRHWLDALALDTLRASPTQMGSSVEATPTYAGAGAPDLLEAMASAINILDETFTYRASAGGCARIIVVLDNDHVIRIPVIHAAVGMLLAHPPPTLQLAIATRVEPPAALGVPRLRARRHLLELSRLDLVAWKHASSKPGCRSPGGSSDSP